MVSAPLVAESLEGDVGRNRPKAIGKELLPRNDRHTPQPTLRTRNAEAVRLLDAIDCDCDGGSAFSENIPPEPGSHATSIHPARSEDG
jgi:hypothetical protein